jgi:hypothetical protein
MDEMIELENEKTGQTRKFPKAIFDSLVTLCLHLLPAAERGQAEGQVWGLVGEYLDAAQAAEPLRMAAEALFPEMKGAIRFNTIPVDMIPLKLKAWSNDMFARYGQPVWLVGSALTGTGRDVDVRIILPDPDFAARFPDHGALGLEVGKQGRWAALFLRMNVDFQIQEQSDASKYDGLPRLRLDACTYPEAFEPPESGIGGNAPAPEAPPA